MSRDQGRFGGLELVRLTGQVVRLNHTIGLIDAASRAWYLFQRHGVDHRSGFDLGVVPASRSLAGSGVSVSGHGLCGQSPADDMNPRCVRGLG